MSKMLSESELAEIIQESECWLLSAPARDARRLLGHIASMDARLVSIYRVALAGQEALRALGADVVTLEVPPSIARALAAYDAAKEAKPLDEQALQDEAERVRETVMARVAAERKRKKAENDGP